MAVNDDAINALTRIYLDLETRLRQSLLTATAQSWEWQRCQALLAQTESELRRLNTYAGEWERRQLVVSFDGGVATAEADLEAITAKHGIQFRQTEEQTWATLHRSALEALSRDIAGQRAQFVGAILRQSRDYLRELTAGEVAAGLGMGHNPRAVGEAIRDGSLAARGNGRALQAVADRIDGACGVVYSDGSVHSLHAYGQMAARTGAMKAHVEASALRYASYGVSLVKVSSHNTLCYLCHPLEGMVFALDEAGEKLGYPPFKARIPRHPNCQHSVSAWVTEVYGEGPKVPADVLQMKDHELYQRMQNDVPDWRQRMEWARRGFRDATQAKRLNAQGIEYGPRYNQPGIEKIRLEAERRVLASGGKLSYRDALAQVQRDARSAK